MASQWFCKVLGQEIGPVGFREMVEMVRAGTLKEDDPIRRDGTSEWIRAGEVIGLFRAAAKESAQTQREGKAEPQPSEAPAKPRQAERPPSAPRRFGRRQVLLAGGLVVGLLLLVAGVSVWRATRRERFPEPRQGRARPVEEDVLAARVGDRSSTASIPVPSDPLPQPAGDDVAELKARFTLDFREDFETQAIGLGGPSRSRFFSVEPSGLRVTIPENSDGQFCAAAVKIRIRGDFRVTARYTILDMPRPTSGLGAGVTVTLEEAQGEHAGMTRRHRQREGHVFGSYRGRPQPDGTVRHSTRHSAPLSETSSEASGGWLRLTRVGTKIRYQVADPNAERFRDIHEEDFTDDEVIRVRLVMQTGGSPTAVDMVWSCFDVQAEKIVKEY